MVVVFLQHFLFLLECSLMKIHEVFKGKVAVFSEK